MEIKIIKSLAKDLGKVHYKELCHVVCELSFDEAFKQLGGYNYDDVEGFFDCNYKSISTTIWRTKFNKCIVNIAFDVWHSDLSSPVCENITIND